ncbi:MAG: archaemetzincin family Zn-dependent metalloprotease [Promethearchaeota archaeon]
MVKKIFIQRIGDLDDSVLLKLKENLDNFFKVFKLKSEILDVSFPLVKTEFVLYRRQYDASKIMRRLIYACEKEKRYPTLGILEQDIYSRSLTFVFGLGRYPFNRHSGVALISIARLKEEFYTKPEDNDLLELRTFKEAIHELGHAFGLKHCENDCVMIFSNKLSDTDNKPAKYCELCFLQVEAFLKRIKKTKINNVP